MLTVLSMVALTLGRIPAAQDPDLPRQVRDILDQYCSSFPKERREEWSLRITSALTLAPPDRLVRLLDGLPKLAGYYESTISFYRELGSNSEGHDRRVVQGYEIFGDQIEIVVKRSATRSESDAQRTAVEEQIRAIVGSARELLKDRLAGPAAVTFVDREMDRFESGLKSGLDLPYSCVMDTPLSARDLEQVLENTRKAALSFERVIVDAKEFGNTRRLAELGVTQLVADVRSAVNTMGKLCYPERSSSVKRENAWIAEIKAALVRERLPDQEQSPEAATPKEVSSVPDVKMDSPRPAENAVPEPVGRSDSGGPAGVNGARPTGAGRSRYPLVILGLVLLGALTWVLLRARGR